MGILYNAGDSREKKAILIGLTGLYFNPIWKELGQPTWVGVNLNYKTLLDNTNHQKFSGDIDILGIPAKGSEPDFDSMFAIEVKTFKFSLTDELKGLGHKIKEAEEQANKLQRLGITRTAILYILTTESDSKTVYPGFQGWINASDRGLLAEDAFKPHIKSSDHINFLWVCGAHPNLSEDEASAGRVRCVYKPSQPISSEESALEVVKGLKQLIMALSKPIMPNWPVIFSLCPRCHNIIQNTNQDILCQVCLQKPKSNLLGS